MGLSMPLTKDLLRAAIGRVLAPGTLEWVTTCDGHTALKLNAGPSRDARLLNELASRAARAISAAALAEREPCHQVTVEFVDAAGTVVHTARLTGEQLGMATSKETVASRAPAQSTTQVPTPTPAPPAPAEGHRPIPGLSISPSSTRDTAMPGVKHIVAVGAGKGGVGKSTIAVNLAVGLARRGLAVGLLDGDIYGPSIPTLLGLEAMEQAVLAGKLQPFLVHGIKAITIGKLVNADKPLIWRGPMAHGAFKQLTEQTHWGELDYLIIDLPPGTGDISLTMAQTLRLTGAVIVCTPQKVAQDDAVRAAKMFQQLNIEVLGVVENMSTFIADDLSPPREYDLFGRGGAERMAQRLGLPFLGAVPITIALRTNSDAGNPTANFAAASNGLRSRLNEALETLVTNLENQVSLASLRGGQAKPTLTIS
jgi:ATP-binding protein involved in chromosome partitioning